MKALKLIEKVEKLFSKKSEIKKDKVNEILTELLIKKGKTLLKLKESKNSDKKEELEERLKALEKLISKAKKLS